MLWVLIWIASTGRGNSNEYPQHMLLQTCRGIQMSTHNICLYKENQNTYHISIIKYATQDVLCSYSFKMCPY